MIRTAQDADADAIAYVVNADALPGQPRCRANDVRQAMAGAATMERAWWDAFTDLTTIVATDGGSVVGAASCAVHSNERTGYVLWLHAREEPTVVGALLTELMHRLATQRCVRAFWIATPLTLGMEALPAHYRPITHASLTRLGFSAHDEWLYMLGRPVTEAAETARVEPRGPNEWELTIREASGATVGTATAEVGRDQIGIVWWLEVKPAYRGQSYGRALLLQAMKLLGSAGAKRLILYVDHGDPSSRDRRPAISLYESVGFRTADHLWSYELTLTPDATQLVGIQAQRLLVTPGTRGAEWIRRWQPPTHTPPRPDGTGFASSLATLEVLIASKVFVARSQWATSRPGR